MGFFEGDTEPTPPEGLVIVGRFEDPVEAQMAKGMLESAGVECFLVGENVNNLLQAAFRVRLQVRVEDEAAARELLDGTGEAAQTD
jgi:Putative prokaryotic signal transducing protein